MENPFKDMDCNAIKDRFPEQGIWFLPTIVTATLFYLGMRRWQD